MKITKALEADILKFIEEYWNTYLSGNLEKFSALIREDYHNIGTTEAEDWRSKQDMMRYSAEVINHMVGTVQIRNRKTHIMPLEPYFMVHEYLDIFILSSDEWVFYSRMRLSSIIEKNDQGWQVIHQHGSVPDTKAQEGESIGFKKISKENLELRDAIKRRTIELEQKNRELEIEAAVERVRAQSMAMQHPDDLDKVNKELLNQLHQLQIPGLTGVTFYLTNENGWVNAWDFSSPGNIGAPKSYTLQFDFTKYEMMGEPFRVLLQSDQDYYVADYTLEKLEKAVYELEKINPVVAHIFKEALSNGKLAHQWSACAKIANGILGVDLVNPPNEDTKNIVLKMAGAFNQAYTRFLDLQKAEAQAREAQIQLALESVHAAAMAMRSSTELGNLIYHLYGELTKLDAKLDRCFIMIVNPENLDITWWLAGKEGLLAENGFAIPNNPHPSHQLYLRHWRDRAKKWTYLFEGQEKADWDHFGFTETELSKLPEFIKNDMAAVKSIHLSGSSDQFGLLVTGSIEPLRDEHQDILSRFTTVFNQTYTRFLDLQKAEAQAREAQIEAALERVRSRSMAMHKSDELLEAGEILFSEMQKLSIESLTAGFVLMDKEDINGLNYTPDPSTKKIMSLPVIIPHNETIHMQRVVENWKKGTSHYVVEMDEEETIQHQTFIAERSTNFTLNAEQLIAISPTRLFLHNFYFKEGYLLIVGGTRLSAEQIDIMLRFAKVFQQTYTRFLDMQKAEAQAVQAEQDLIEIKIARQKAEDTLKKLKATQDQLVQQEKLASLGQLTAGIAHEIKNPLNFINNFSEVSIEMLEEAIEEMAISQESRDDNLLKELLEDIKSNLKKVHEHGSRANGIVSSMLQHSRGSSGIMEPTDLNALIKEYAYLAFHGMRAGKHPINIDIQLELSENINKVKLIGEDMSRIIVNLCNNAFDAMRATAELRVPRLIIRTKLQSERILIEVEDNGPGIPEDIKDKILQPFFTTKKGTEGTGLGLSITHDIVKAHGGELFINNLPESGALFIISLPDIIGS